MANMSITIREIVVSAMAIAIGLPNSGRLRDKGGATRIELVGVPTRAMVNESVVVPCVVSICGGVKVQLSQLGSAAPVSPSAQKNVTVPERLA
jgi:hypothetical protein